MSWPHNKISINSQALFLWKKARKRKEKILKNELKNNNNFKKSTLICIQKFKLKNKIKLI